MILKGQSHGIKEWFYWSQWIENPFNIPVKGFKLIVQYQQFNTYFWILSLPAVYTSFARTLHMRRSTVPMIQTV